MKLKSVLLTILLSIFVAGTAQAKKHWVGTWATAEQLVEPHNCPPDPGLGNNSIRQIVQTSISGKVVRVKFSNEFSNGPVTINVVGCMKTAGSSSDILKDGGEPHLTGTFSNHSAGSTCHR